MPECRIEDARVAGVQGNVRGASICIHLQDMFPALTAIAGAVNPPLGVGSPDLPLNGDPGGIRVRGVDLDLGNLPRVR